MFNTVLESVIEEKGSGVRWTGKHALHPPPPPQLSLSPLQEALKEKRENIFLPFSNDCHRLKGGDKIRKWFLFSFFKEWCLPALLFSDDDGCWVVQICAVAFCVCLFQPLWSLPVVLVVFWWAGWTVQQVCRCYQKREGERDRQTLRRKRRKGRFQVKLGFVLSGVGSVWRWRKKGGKKCANQRSKAPIHPYPHTHSYTHTNFPHATFLPVQTVAIRACLFCKNVLVLWEAQKHVFIVHMHAGNKYTKLVGTWEPRRKTSSRRRAGLPGLGETKCVTCPYVRRSNI